MNLQIAAALMMKIKSNDSVKNIFKKSVSTLYSALKNNHIDEDEYQVEYNNLVYKCSLLAD